VCKKVSYPYKTTDTITVVHILIADSMTKDCGEKYNRHSECLISSYAHHEWNFNVTLISIYLQIPVQYSINLFVICWEP
jgi:hypothetical protein